MAVIYKATNKINGKSYIGYDSAWPSRKQNHLWYADKSNDETKCPHFHRALKKHGVDNFDWTILKEEATLEDEVKLIEEHNTFYDGYNLTKGGDGTLGWIPSDEVKQKISDKAKGNQYCVGRILSNETKQKISKSLQGKPSPLKGKTSPIRGRKRTPEAIANGVAARKGYQHSKETRDKISKANTGHVPSKKQLETLRQNAQKMKELGHTEQTKQKISRAHKGKIISNKTRQKISDNHASKKETGAFYKSTEYREKMSNSLKGKTRTPEQKERYRLAALRRHNKDLS